MQGARTAEARIAEDIPLCCEHANGSYGASWGSVSGLHQVDPGELFGGSFRDPDDMSWRTGVNQRFIYAGKTHDFVSSRGSGSIRSRRYTFQIKLSEGTCVASLVGVTDMPYHLRAGSKVYTGSLSTYTSRKPADKQGLRLLERTN